MPRPSPFPAAPELTERPRVTAKPAPIMALINRWTRKPATEDGCPTIILPIMGSIPIIAIIAIITPKATPPARPA